jgi:hypothetical protein
MIEKNDLQRKLARTVLGFQDSYLARDNSPVGLLCQVGLSTGNLLNPLFAAFTMP